MPSTKYDGVSYPTHYLKSRDSVVRNNFLEFSFIFARRNNLYALYATNKAKYIINRLFSWSCSDTNL